MGGWDASETASRQEGKPKQKFNEKATVVVALYERKLSIPPIRYAFYLFLFILPYPFVSSLISDYSLFLIFSHFLYVSTLYT